jgi:PAS domain S-box-containing protein
MKATMLIFVQPNDQHYTNRTMKTQTEFLATKGFIGTLITMVRDGLLVLDSSNSVILSNEPALNILGFSTSEEAYGLDIRKIFADANDAAAFSKTLDLNTRCERRESTFVHINGKKFTGVYSVAPIPDQEGNTHHKLVSLRDISGEKKAEMKLAESMKLLEKSNKELDQFSYIISHDLKAPLRAISNLSLWLQEDLGTSLSEDNNHHLTMLRGRVARMESLINGVLEYSKIGRTNVSLESVDTFVLIGEIIEMLSPPVNMEIKVSSALPVIEAPKIMLLQVFSNLISNAIKYNDKEKGLIVISHEEKESGHEFSISDNGPGIAPEFHEKIFVIFQTLQSRDKFESTGIGLTIVKRILEDRGGSIRVESAPEKGSTFIFNWPKLHA